MHTTSRTLAPVVQWLGRDGSTPGELRYGAIISVWIRWIWLAGALFEINYPDGYTDRYYALNTLYCLTPAVINGYVYHRLRTGRTVGAGWLFALSAMDFCMVSFSIYVTGGLESKFHQVYYLVIAMFAVVFTSFRLTLLWTTMMATVYTVMCFTVGQGLDPADGDLKDLVTRLTCLYAIGCVVSLISRYERMQRRQAIARETQTHQDRIELSQSIHDTVGQSAYMIGMGIDNAKDLAGGTNPELTASLDATGRLARSAIWALRHPIDGGLIFEGRELAPLMTSHAATFTAITSIPATVTQDGPEPELPTTARSLLFSVAHNAMTNAFRHSGASKVDIHLEFRQHNLTITVTDDGQGLPGDRVQTGHGLRNMQAHAARMGGGLTIVASDPGPGTTVTCTIPVPPREGGTDHG